MFDTLLARVFGTKHEREIKRLAPRVDHISSLAPEFEALTDEQLQAKTDEFKRRYRDGESLDDLLPEAFATCREASWRVMGMRHFDVQLIGGMVLHQGKIAEMKTGEGKTLAATLPVYLQCPVRARRPRRHRQRLLSPQRDVRVDGRGSTRWLGLQRRRDRSTA